MKYEKFLYLVGGIVVWGAVAGGAASMLGDVNSREIVWAVAACVGSAALATLAIWFFSKRGFSADPPFLWFFLPMIGLLYVGFRVVAK